MNRISLKEHLAKGPVTCGFTLHLRVRDHTTCWDGLWALSFGLSQFHGHGSWLMCEVPQRQIPLGVVTPLSTHSRRSENVAVAPST